LLLVRRESDLRFLRGAVARCVRTRAGDRLAVRLAAGERDAAGNEHRDDERAAHAKTHRSSPTLDRACGPVPADCRAGVGAVPSPDPGDGGGRRAPVRSAAAPVKVSRHRADTALGQEVPMPEFLIFAVAVTMCVLCFAGGFVAALALRIAGQSAI